MIMTSEQIRTKFLTYFQEQGHQIVPSSSLVPGNDPTLLFTNAGMVQFKDVFLGLEPRSYTRAVSAQRCVRAGGKHNDLDNVGYTARHHTFFEMLGNFSFGDYFKREAIAYAWEFLTKVLAIPAEKLWVTVFEKDDEAENIWVNEIGFPKSRISRCGMSDNFWSMGDTGPCGPCSEIYYDHGAAIPGGPPGSIDQEGDRYVEIWNLVFMQYNRAPDGTLTPLPKPSVDTGMGLERISAVMQNVHNNYDIDLFKKLIAAITQLLPQPTTNTTSLRVIADHIRSCAFLIADGVLPSNEGRGYVLRRIIRRAIRHGQHVGFLEPFFYRLVAPLAQLMGQAYPELAALQNQISQALLQEEQQFAKTLDLGLKILSLAIADLKTKEIPGAVVFKLYDTYGFPPDLTADIARERNLSIDMPGFEIEMNQQRQQSQQASQFEVTYPTQLPVNTPTDFTGYDFGTTKTKIIALLNEQGLPVDMLQVGESGLVILENSPFYAESGGQVGDCGLIECGPSVFEVQDTKKQGSIHVHYGRMKSGELHIQKIVTATIDSERRQAIRLNHSATHLLHAALRKIVGTSVVQKGSLVAPDRLRFDFSHHAPLTVTQLKAVEMLVNQEIRANYESKTEIMAPEVAVAKGAMALFGEKYGETVRVLQMGDFSTELCGGTHVNRTGDIGLFKIVQETGVAANVRRIEAVTGVAALQKVLEAEADLKQIADKLKADRSKIHEKLQQILDSQREAEKQIANLHAKIASFLNEQLQAKIQTVNDVNFLIEEVNLPGGKALRELLDQLKTKLPKAVIVLGCIHEEQVHLVAGVSKEITHLVHAGELINHVAARVGGKGGGRADMAQAGGPDIAHLPQALSVAKAWVSEKLSVF